MSLINKVKLESERDKLIRLLEDAKLCLRIPRNINYTKEVLKEINTSLGNTLAKLNEAEIVIRNLQKEIILNNLCKSP